jgi:hypothetical protein
VNRRRWVVKKLGRGSMGRKTGEQEEVGSKKVEGRVWEGRQESRRRSVVPKAGRESMGR